MQITATWVKVKFSLTTPYALSFVLRRKLITIYATRILNYNKNWVIRLKVRGLSY
jgi:hypothetical protein